MTVRSRRVLLVLGGVLLAAPAIRAQNAASIDPAFFSTKLFPIMEAAHCRNCHANDGVASATRLHFPEKGSSEDRIQLFGLSLAVLVDRADFSKSLLLNKPTMRIPHTGGERIKPGSDEDKVLTAWVESLASASDEALAAARRNLGDVPEGAEPSQLVRRLTHSQYNNTVRDLLGDYSRPAQRFPPEDYVDGFKNQLGAQGMPPLLVETYSTAAEKLALNAFRIGDVNGLIPCKPASAADEKCRDRFVREFGLRAFRRPLRDDELQRYSAAFSEQARASGKFLEGARIVVEAMLQSPDFLFHLEAGPDGRSTDYDVASRLAYLLWNTMPDRALLEAAEKGELRTVEGRVQAARRMLDNPLAHQALDEFFDEWLRLDRVVNAVKQGRQYPEFSPELAAAMAEETRRFLHYLVWEDRSFMEAFSADYSFLTTELASLYKLPAPPGQFEMVRFPADARRAGLLGQGSFLASTAGPTDTSPTARGIFIREQLLCQHVPPPPPGVNTTLPEPNEATPRTRRQLMVAHVENPTCAACHRLMDPIGFGLENYDAIGRWREKETILIPTQRNAEDRRRKPKEIDLDIEAQGEIAGLPHSQFSDPKQLGTILAESPVCQKCIVRQMFRYAYGRLETAADEETIDALFASFRDSGFRFKDLLIALVRSPEFVRAWDNTSQIAQGPGTDRNTGNR
jgi:Protein of unknown function (DUF1592)/Protein of unknown function (DUF1588)/Protein of unknown function (DUF1587)/Protein of unknown function (DUF1595)/Protein of unknown function (DUF1585)